MKFLVYNIAYGTGAPRSRLDQVISLPRYLHTGRSHLEDVITGIARRAPDVTGLLEVDNGSFRTGYHSQGEQIARALHQHVYSAVKYEPGSLSRKIPILRRQTNVFLSPEKQLPCAFHYLSAGMKRLAMEIQVNGVRFFLLHLSLRRPVRERQLRDLRELIEPVRTPFLIGGDFNVFAGRGELESFMAELGLNSANERDLPTFPSWCPKKQLDYILYSKGIDPVRFEVGNECASDHLPVLFEFELR
ncbi:MAG: endonuclease/exonuclease/phosphatase family protein [Lentisphaeria bacterium]|nr:endonuclease/exonuclease/phosphatase family protein [Lentisphaeria bacterium]